MLSRVFIQNLATVEKQSLEFDQGFTALTGETGAGKSIIIKAISLILGEKCPKDLIRAGEDFLSVEAVSTAGGDGGWNKFHKAKAPNPITTKANRTRAALCRFL